MRTSLKIAVSLLVAVVAFTALALFAFSGLFDLVEGAFFQPRVQQRSAERASTLVDAIDECHRVNVERYQSVLTASHVVSAFLSNQSRESIVARRNAFDRLHAEFPSLLFVRFVGTGGDTLHYSTLPTDVVRGGDFVQTYAIPRDLDDPPAAAALHAGDGAPLVLAEPEQKRFLYSFPITDQFGVFRGSGLFYVAVADVANHLTRVQAAEFRRLDLLPGGVLVNSPQPTSTFIAATVQAWAARDVAAVTSLRVAAADTADAAADGRFVLFTGTGEYGRVGLIIAAQTLTISASMRWTLLGAGAATLFLLVFLLLNLRQDPAVVLADRIKRFQVTFLREFLEERERLDWDEWRSELAVRKAEAKTRLTAGARASKGGGDESERLFDRSWDEIVGVLAGRAEQARGPVTNVTVDAAQIEQIVRRALAGGAPIGTLPPPADGDRGEPEEAEALEEVAEAEEVEEVEALEEVAEAEEVEEVEALEQVADAEPPYIPGPGALVEELLEELGDEEELETEELDIDEALLDDAADPADEGELEELAEVGSIEPLPPDRPYEDLEELQELEDAAELEDFAAVPAADDAAMAHFVDRLRGAGKLVSFTLAELEAAVSEVRESVALEDGVYRIKPEVVASRGRTKSLFRLAERARSREVEDPSVGGPQGIGDLFGGSAAVDSLFGADTDARDRPETLSSLRGDSRERRLPVSDVGLELDQLLRQYPRPKEDTTLVRCLVNLSRPLEAVGTVLMVRQDDAYVATQTVGLMEGSAAGLRHAAGSELYDSHLSDRDGVLLLEAIPSLAGAFAAADVEMVKRILYLPVRYQDADAYLLLASREPEESWDLPLLVDKLGLYPG